VTLANNGSRPVEETVQCYVQPPRTLADAPLATLVDFQKVAVPPRRSVEVTFKLPATAFEQVDATGKRVRIPGRYGVVVGSASPGERAQALGAPKPATAQLTLL
jgi:beta-glucosidase